MSLQRIRASCLEEKKTHTHIHGAPRLRHEKSEDNTAISDPLVMDKGKKGIREG